jgi:hypothetical protein
MTHSKEIENGYIIGAWSGLDRGEEISEEEYQTIYNVLTNPPERKDGYYYKLKTDLTWEEIKDEYEAEPTEEDDTAAMLVDMDYRLTLLELGLTE